MPEFLVLALLCGLGVALVSGPLGSFVVWRRMAYFGDTLAHSALLGAAVGIMLKFNPLWAVLFCCVLIAALMTLIQTQKALTNDTVLGIISHSALALGLVCASFISDTRLDLWGILFGDLLTVTRSDVITIYLIAATVLALLCVFWRSLLLATLDENLARAEGLPVTKLRLLLMVMTATVVALAMKVVGVLLITALLIIPAATSRRLSRSPEQMAILAAVLGAIAVALGLLASFYLDTPAGPSIVLASTGLFALSYIKKAL